MVENSTMIRSRALEWQRRGPRQKFQIFYDILSAIRDESISHGGGAKPTTIQRVSNLSYDKLNRYLHELQNKRMIHRSRTLSLTERGHSYLKHFEELKKFTESMGYE